MTERRHKAARRGWRALGWALSVFVLAQLVGGLLLDYVWPELRFPTAALTFKALEKQPKSPDIVCVGSSRFGAGFVQEKVREQMRATTGDIELTVFNAAIEAGDLVTARYVMNHAFDQGIQPKMIVIEVSPETLARRCEWMGQHVLRQLTWEEIPGYLSDIYRSGNTVRLLSARFVPLHMHRRQICLTLQQYAEQHVRAALRPSKPNKPGKESKKEKAIAAAPDQGVPWEIFKELRDDRHDPWRMQAGLPAIRRWLQDYHIGGGSGRALDELVQRCRDQGMTVILVGVPVAEGHRALYTPEINEAFLNRVTSVARRHGARFVDYRDRLPDELFRDNHHLRQCGGEEFSRLLTQEVLVPAWMERREVVANSK
jgi:hypothetical protein